MDIKQLVRSYQLDYAQRKAIAEAEPDNTWTKEEVEGLLHVQAMIETYDVLEDLVDALDSNNVLKKNKLPQSTRDKINKKKANRGRVQP